MPRQGGVTASGKTLGVVTINNTDVRRYSFRLGDRSTHQAVSTKYQDKATGKYTTIQLHIVATDQDQLYNINSELRATGFVHMVL